MPEVREYCHQWVGRAAPRRCDRPAVVIVWGKLSHPDELGPRCQDHLPSWLHMHQVDQYAVFDLRGLERVTS